MCYNPPYENLAENITFCGGLDLRAHFAVVAFGGFACWADNLLVNICGGDFFRICFGHTLFKPAHRAFFSDNFFDFGYDSQNKNQNLKSSLNKFRRANTFPAHCTGG